MYLEYAIDEANMAELVLLDPDAFTRHRRNGFGASDSSILLGVNKWTTLDQLIEQKNSKDITDAEREVSSKPQVKMGNICEPGILECFKVWSGIDKVEKPAEQYRFLAAPQLTVNYDGLATDDCTFPVECKYVSVFAVKYWDWDKSVKNYGDAPTTKLNIDGCDVSDIIHQSAEFYGIPPYYFTQVQQQLLGTMSDYAWLCACNSKTGDVHFFKIWEDERVQTAIQDVSALALELCPGMQSYIKERW